MAQARNGFAGHVGATAAASNGVLAGSNIPGSVGVNRKKQKRRAKQAAKQAAEQSQTPPAPGLPSLPLDANIRNGLVPQGRSTLQHPSSPHQAAHRALDYEDPDLTDSEPFDADEAYSTDGEGQICGQHDTAGMGPVDGHYGDNYVTNDSSRRPKKKKKGRMAAHHPAHHYSPPATVPLASHMPHPPPPPPPPLSTAALRTVQRNNNRDRIWNTSTQEERERIKEFWLSLGEDERKSLVKIEKEAVLRKMKEQQKHSCSCTVCGRKRTAIEEELEVLYDAYYDELEQYANHQQGIENGVPMPPPSRRLGQPFGRLPSGRIPPPLINAHQPSRGRIRELVDDEEEDDDDEEDEEEDGDDEEYSDEDEDDEYSDEEPEEIHSGPAADFFNFGNSLTVKGGILTVADDLLKNDGKKFIEMMEQLAERRMQREEEAQYAAAGLTNPSSMQDSHAGHNHGPAGEDEEYGDEDEEYDSQEEDYDEDEDEPDHMTEEQRMEEGRRMFQIFAARMFEQRVLTAYREKVARERQQKLLEELEEESRLDVQREAKKARDAQKKKDKKQQQKQAKAEERARKEAEKAAEEAASKAIEEKRQEEQKRKREEQRKKKEAERKAQEEEKHRKEAERVKRQQEERERQLEAERKIRDQRAQEKKAREEAKKQEREEREAREREVKERKAQEERGRKEREAKAKAEKETKERETKEKEAKERARKAEQAQQITAQSSQPSKRPNQPTVVAIPPGLSGKQSSAAPSPHVQVATPAVSKAPTPVRPRQSSQQGSHGSSPSALQVESKPAKSVSPTNGIPQQQSATAPKTILTRPATQQQPQPNLHQPQPSSPMPPIAPPPGMAPTPGPGFGVPPGVNGFPHSQGPPMHSMSQRAPIGHHMPIYPPQPPPIGAQYRSFPPPSGPPGLPPGISAPGMMPLGRGFLPDPPPGFPQQLPGMGAGTQMPQFAVVRDTMPAHSRQQSMSERPGFEPPIIPPQTQPIARPAPIQRPGSVKPAEGDQEHKPSNADVDDLSNHLGSSALLDDTDEPIPANENDARRGSVVPGMPRASSMGFGASPLFANPPGQPRMDSFGIGPGSSGAPSTWGTPTIPFGPPGMPGAASWGSSPTSGWANSSPFGMSGTPHRPSLSRPVHIRQMVCQACRQLTASKSGSDGLHELGDVLRQVELIKPMGDVPVQLPEIETILETEGDSHNGGGSFVIKRESPNRTLVKWEADNHLPNLGPRGSGLGEIGSPVPGHSMPFGSARPFY